MNSHLFFDFTVNKDNKSIHVKREFDAALSLVWDAWTKAELLDQWWAPKPWKAKTKTMDFREGGYWLYAMVGPEGEEHWSKVAYLSIKNEQFFKANDGFCDSEGNLNKSFPITVWENNFSQQNGLIVVDIQLSFDKLEDLEKIIKMGFKEGFTMGLNQLEELLSALKN